MANPLYGTTTMHAAAWFSTWGEARARDFFRELKANGVRIAASNGEVKRLVVAGEVAFGLTDTDDAHEAKQAGAPVEIVYPDQSGDGTLVMPTVAVLIRGGPNPERGKALIDHLLGAAVEGDMAKRAAHMPLRADVPVPEGVRRVGSIRAMKVEFDALAQTMERIQPWLREWVGL
jgi:iron(III) transport system substrate-binding protein